MTENQAAKRVSLEDPSLYINRELSWIAFNERVLDQAHDADWPLLERVKFLAIFASNLDEFFMIRVAGLHEQLESQVTEKGPDGLSVREQLVSLGQHVRRQTQMASSLFRDVLLPELTASGIRLRQWSSLSAEEQDAARAHFRMAVFPVLTPLAVDPAHPFPFLSNLSLSLAVEALDPITSVRRFARVKVPESLPRFVPLSPSPDTPPSSKHQELDLLALEDLIAHNLGDLFPGMEITGCWPFRVTRDMDLELLEQEADDLLLQIDRELRRRRFGAAVRLELDPSLPPYLRQLLLAKLELEEDDVYEQPGPLALSALFGIASIARADLHDAPMISSASRVGEGAHLFAAIRADDVLLHHPYESFLPVLELLRAAAEDPDVLAIKMTLYRAGSNAEAVRSLIRAAENGKQVAVSIELKARFDEERNVLWARSMERAGVHVFYGMSGFKTHAKVILVVRREGPELRRYVHLSTGNYNAQTAKLYTDVGLFTADPSIGEDASELFNSLSGFSRGSRYRKIAVAPITLRETLLGKIDEQMERARSGQEGKIFAKINALVDTGIIRALYRASQAGVAIDLVIRGVCCLRPGVAGVSDHIRVRSLVGRFLEHERVFVFGSGESEEFYLSSADWMPRNLDRRVEILAPVSSGRARERIRQECLLPLEADNCRVYEMSADGEYRKRRPLPGHPMLDAQLLVASRPSQNGVAKGDLRHAVPSTEAAALA